MYFLSVTKLFAYLYDVIFVSLLIIIDWCYRENYVNKQEYCPKLKDIHLTNI